MFYLLPVVVALLPSLAMAFDEKALRLPKKYADFFPAGPVKLAAVQPKTEITSRRLGETVPGAGWIYFTGYAGQECNYGEPVIVRAQATNVCLQSTDTDGEDRAFLFTCDSPTAAHIAIYNGTTCDSANRLVNTVLLMDDCTPNEDFDGSQIPYSYYAQCTTSSGIPFSEDLSYFSIEYSNDAACTDTLSFQGELNNVCIAKNLTYAVKPVYPEYFVYDNYLCQGTPVTSSVYTGSCTTRTEPQIPNLVQPAEHYQTYDLVTGSYSSSSNSPLLSTGALAGVIVGSVVGGLCVLFVLYYCIVYKFSHTSSLSSQEQGKV